MSEDVNALISLAHLKMKAAKKRKDMAKYFKTAGMLNLGKGVWLAHRSRDVVSGLVIDGPWSKVIINSFILPPYDRLEFVNLSLGEKITECDLNADSRENSEYSIDRFKKNYADIKSSRDFINYIDDNSISGFYPIWVRYITYCRELEFDAAMAYLDAGKRAQLHRSVLGRFDELGAAVASRQEQAVKKIFEAWSAVSERTFGPLDKTFNAF